MHQTVVLNQASLSLEQAPPISVPLRFFLTAPLFLLAAGVLLLTVGADALSTRWSPVTLALTHLLTLGFLGMVMLGAMMQMLPVLAGSPVPGVVWVSGLSHLLMTVGVMALTVGFLQGSRLAMYLALAGLGGGLILFILGVAVALWRARAPNVTVTSMRYALFGLLLTLSLGDLLAYSLFRPLPMLDSLRLTNIHLGWGLLVWTGGLVLGVAYQVVPMFQLTAEYPRWMTRYFSHMLFSLLLLWSLLYLLEAPALFTGAVVSLLGLGFGLFALTTLRLQAGRKRKLADVTLDFWRLGMVMLLLVLPAWWLGLVDEGLELLHGVLIILGFAVSVVIGMLYKIVPFLSWFHLQHRKVALMGGKGPRIPTMQEFISTRAARWHFYLHLATLGAMLLAVFFQENWAYMAGFLLSLSALMLCYNLLQAVRRFRRVRCELEQVV